MAVAEPPFKIEPLGDRHDRAAFACESEAQTNYFRQTARQHHESGVSTIFVLTETKTGRIAGYYTLSMHMIAAGDVPPPVLKAYKLPKRGMLPAALIGRLARDLEFQGRGIGPVLAYDALKRVRDAREHIGCVAIVVDPDGEEARRFWIRLVFLELPSQSRVFLPIGTVEHMR